MKAEPRMLYGNVLAVIIEVPGLTKTLVICADEVARATIIRARVDPGRVWTLDEARALRMFEREERLKVAEAKLVMRGSVARVTREETKPVETSGNNEDW